MQLDIYQQHFLMAMFIMLLVVVCLVTFSYLARKKVGQVNSTKSPHADVVAAEQSFLSQLSASNLSAAEQEELHELFKEIYLKHQGASQMAMQAVARYIKKNGLEQALNQEIVRLQTLQTLQTTAAPPNPITYAQILSERLSAEGLGDYLDDFRQILARKYPVLLSGWDEPIRNFIPDDRIPAYVENFLKDVGTECLIWSTELEAKGVRPTYGAGGK